MFKLECQVTGKQTGRGYVRVTYGVTSLRRDEADAHPGPLRQDALGDRERAPYRRDVTFHEDGCRLQRPPATHVMAILNNIALG